MARLDKSKPKKKRHRESYDRWLNASILLADIQCHILCMNENFSYQFWQPIVNVNVFYINEF